MGQHGEDGWNSGEGPNKVRCAVGRGRAVDLQLMYCDNSPATMCTSSINYKRLRAAAGLQVGLKLPQQRHPAYGVVRSTIRDGNDQDDLTDGVDQVRYSGQCFLLLLCCTVLLLGSFYW